MPLPDLHSVSQLSAALMRKFGSESQVKTAERKNAEGEDVVEITVVKVIKDEPKIEWKQSTFGSTDTADFGFFKVSVSYRSGSRDNPIPDTERYEFSINGLSSKKKFPSAEEAKRVAMASVRNKLNAAMQKLNG